jgi:hypothetical protein
VARPLRILVPALAVVVAALALAACGGSGDDGNSEALGGADQAEIAHAVRTAATSSDPDDCTRVETQRYLEQIHFVTGSAAVNACRQDAPDTSDDPDSVDVADIEVDGTNATANETFHGGGFDGSTLSLALIRQGDQWRVDEITGVPTFDLPAFEKAFTQRLSSREGVSGAGTACVTKALNSAGPDAVKGALIGGDASQLLSLIGPCLSGSSPG